MHVQTLPFREVHKVKFHFANLALILNFEVEPLVMSTSIRIYSHVAVIFGLLSLDNHIEISRLER